MTPGAQDKAKKNMVGLDRIPDPKRNFDSGRSKRIFPKYHDTSSRTRPIMGGAGSPWVANITDENILYLYRRDELAQKAVKKLAGAVFNKWLTIHSDNDALKDAIEELFNRLDVQSIFKSAYEKMKVLGFSLIALGFEEILPDATKMPENVTGLSYINAIQKKSVDKIYQELDPTNEKYGQIVEYDILRPEGQSDVKVRMPASRFIHWVNGFVDDDPEGISIFESVYDKFSIKKNLDFAVGEVPYQMARPLPVLTTPKDALEDELDAAEDVFRNINARSYYMLSEVYDFKLHGTNVALNPEPYTDYIIGTIAAALTGSKIALLGTEAGAVTGSEVNQQEWFAMVSDEQRNVVEPMLKAFVRIGQFYGYLPAGEWWPEWEALFELDANEEAEIQLKNAQALQATAVALGLLQVQGFVPVIEDGQMLFEISGQRVAIPATNALIVSRSREPDILSSQQRGINVQAPFLPTEERKKLFDEWEVKSTDIENKTADGVQTHVVIMGDQFMEAFRISWEKNIKPIKVDPSMPQQGMKVDVDVMGNKMEPKTSDEADLFEEMDEFIPKDLRKYKADLIKFLEGAYITGAEQTLELLGLDPATFSLTDTGAVRSLRVEGARLAKQTYLDQHKGAMNEIANGLQAGESYKSINNRIAQSFKEFSKGIPNTVQKFVHATTSAARWDEMEARGRKDGVFTTAQDDRVRPEHAALDGQIMTRSEAMPWLSEFGCRCTIVARTAYDRAVEAHRKEVEQVTEVAMKKEGK